jgi:hypothetical protein
MKNTLAQEAAAARACISLLRSIMHDGAVAIHTHAARLRQDKHTAGAAQRKTSYIDARAGTHLQQKRRLIPHLFALWRESYHMVAFQFKKSKQR